MMINVFTILFITIILGNIISKIRIKGILLGKGMILITGLIVSYFLGEYIKRIPNTNPNFIFYKELLSNNMIPGYIFNFFLMLFISGIGLLAGKDFIKVFKKYGVKFIIISILITTVAAMGIFIIDSIDNVHSKYELAGVFSGALTSTPGMTAALESSENRAIIELVDFNNLSEFKKNQITNIIGKVENNIITKDQKEKYIEHAMASAGIGYTLSYPFGIIVVIMMMNLLPIVFKIDIKKEKDIYEKELLKVNSKNYKKSEKKYDEKFDITSYFFVLFLGYILGLINIKSFSLTITGGVILSSLILSSIGKVFCFDFRFNNTVLIEIKEIGLVGTLASIGLRLGYQIISGISNNQIILIFYSIIIGLVAIVVGFIVGRYIFKLNWLLLSGAICGAMTSTPGLGVAVDSTDSNYPSVGYASTYPFALIFMVIYSILIHSF